VLSGGRPGAGSILFDSPSHQRRMFTVVSGVERRQQLPAIRREPLNGGMPDIAEHLLP